MRIRVREMYPPREKSNNPLSVINNLRRWLVGMLVEPGTLVLGFSEWITRVPEDHERNVI